MEEYVEAALGRGRSAFSHGAPIRYYDSAPEAALPPLTLVHGKGAHAMWWHGVVPFLTSVFRCLTVDLSGHGDSGHRTTYNMGLWAADVVAVCDAAGVRSSVLVGHSRGGRVCLEYAALYRERTEGVVLIDTLLLWDHRLPPSERRGQVGDGRTYKSRDELLGRFRLIPEQPEPERATVRPLAQYGAHHSPEGWMWKHDPQATRVLDSEFEWPASLLADLPAAYIYGIQAALATQEFVAALRANAPKMAFHAVEGAHHHVILDAPAMTANLIARVASHMTAGPGSAAVTA